MFDLGLNLEIEATPPPLVDMGGIPRRSYWDYRDVGGEPDPSWKTQLFSSGPDWKNGYAPLGYGESYLATIVSYGPDPANKHITTHFTHNFSTYNPGAVTSTGLARLRVNDAVIGRGRGLDGIDRVDGPERLLIPGHVGQHPAAQLRRQERPQLVPGRRHVFLGNRADGSVNRRDGGMTIASTSPRAARSHVPDRGRTSRSRSA
ncbi:MAG TPA: hypothetical protein VFU21_24770 [Kofleriaceae bacterium]|nr:hypothetical protein [Kofleriaceae bacterium]